MDIGILDPAGKNNNPLTDEPYSAEYKKWAKVWSKFPAYENAKTIIKDIQNNQVVLIVSGTGSGKTVLVPKYALHALDYKGRIAITLPKQIVTKSSAEFAATTLDVKLGEHIGYKYKGSPREVQSKTTKLLYATDGTIVQKLLNDPSLQEFNCVIIDEAHERKIQIDFLMYLLRNAILLRPDLKVIIMSATINAAIFKDYFSKFKFKEINIGGKTNYPIKSIFLPSKIEYDQSMEEGYKMILHLLTEDDPKKAGAHDILFFITSQNEAFDICKKLANDVQREKGKKCQLTCHGQTYCVEVFSGMDAEKQTLAQDKILYKKSGEYSRKLVVSTNVAESSLTIDGIKYVIDLGYELSSSYDPDLRARRLDRQLITHAQAKQRMGRSGRTEPGVCYHLYTKEDFDKNMERFPQPDIRTSDIASESLRLLSMESVQTVDKLLKIFSSFIEPPRENYLKSAITDLTNLGAIESSNITKLGILMSNMGGDTPQSSLTVIMGKIYNCYREILKIQNLIDVSNANMAKIFVLPRQLVRRKPKEQHSDYNKRLQQATREYNNKKKNLMHKYGDHLSLLKIFNIFDEKYNKKKSEAVKWCKYNNLKYKTLEKALKYYIRSLRQIGRNLPKNFRASDINLQFREDIIKLPIEDRVSICLMQGYRMNTAIQGQNGYRTRYSQKLLADISRNSFLKLNKKPPKHVYYNELFINMGSSSINIVSKIPKNLFKILS